MPLLFPSIAQYTNIIIFSFQDMLVFTVKQLLYLIILQTIIFSINSVVPFKNLVVKNFFCMYIPAVPTVQPPPAPTPPHPALLCAHSALSGAHPDQRRILTEPVSHYPSPNPGKQSE